MTGTIDKEIGGLACHCNPLPFYPTGAKLKLELAAIAAPALARLAPNVEGAKVDLSKPGYLAELASKVDAGAALEGVADALKRLAYEDEKRFERVTGILLRGVSVELPTEAGIKMRTLNSTDGINAVLSAGGGYVLFWNLLRFALEANYGDFFSAVSGGGSTAGLPSFRLG